MIPSASSSSSCEILDTALQELGIVSDARRLCAVRARDEVCTDFGIANPALDIYIYMIYIYIYVYLGIYRLGYLGSKETSADYRGVKSMVPSSPSGSQEPKTLNL